MNLLLVYFQMAQLIGRTGTGGPGMGRISSASSVSTSNSSPELHVLPCVLVLYGILIL